MDFDAVAAGLNEAIPFNRHLGLVVEEVAPGRGVVTLPDGEHLHNHVGSQHAGGLFSAGAGASGGSFLAASAEHPAGFAPLMKTASIAYRNSARGPITAVGVLDTDV